VAPDRRQFRLWRLGRRDDLRPRTLTSPRWYRAATAATGLVPDPWQRTRLLAFTARGPVFAALSRAFVVFVAVALPRKSARPGSASGPPGPGPWSRPGASGPAWPTLGRVRRGPVRRRGLAELACDVIVVAVAQAEPDVVADLDLTLAGDAVDQAGLEPSCAQRRIARGWSTAFPPVLRLGCPGVLLDR